jgi:hypothetical protein
VTRNRHPVALAALVVCSTVVGLSGCRKSSQDVVAPAAPVAAADASAPWTREAVDVQERMAELRQRTPPDSGATPGTTSWRISSEPAVGGARVVHAATPGALLASLSVSHGWADVLGDAAWEQTMRVWTDGNDVAVGVVLLWDFMDDAVAGHDWRISMRRTGNGWGVERIEERYHCRRKVSADGRCA